MKGLSVDTQLVVPVITIDGPSGVGKGTTCALVAEALGWHLLDSGAIYRAMALKAIGEGIKPEDEVALQSAAEQIDLRFEVTENLDIAIYLDGKQVNDELRTEACGEMASKIAPNPAMRTALFDRQKDFQQAPGLVADGRDMGTVVFQAAPLKVFLTASAEERAKRRHKQLQQKGVDVRIRDLLKDIEARDLRDSSRKVAPLVPAEDAHVIDTSDLSIEEVLELVLTLAKKYGLQS
nr:(d)CMP kinase [Marinicella rhabdoformis]